jgi:hypothetical protein
VDEPTVYNPAGSCGEVLAINEGDALAAAQSIELCKRAKGPGDWGLVSARWVMADGSPAPADPVFHRGHGVLSAFGPNVAPRAGATMLALSSGTARQPTDPGWVDPEGFDKGLLGHHPDGFPKETPACPGVVTGDAHDDTGLELALVAPPGAEGFSFDFAFYTYEWPYYICSQFNDLFVSLLSPVPEGQVDGNISFDGDKNLISVNSAFLGACGCGESVCWDSGKQFPCPCEAGGKQYACALGTKPLAGTGFDAAASTGWLVTTAPAAGGQELTLRWAIYDSGDGILDSTTLIDNWQWIVEPGVIVTTTRVPE